MIYRFVKFLLLLLLFTGRTLHVYPIFIINPCGFIFTCDFLLEVKIFLSNSFIFLVRPTPAFGSMSNVEYAYLSSLLKQNSSHTRQKP